MPEQKHRTHEARLKWLKAKEAAYYAAIDALIVLMDNFGDHYYHDILATLRRGLSSVQELIEGYEKDLI